MLNYSTTTSSRRDFLKAGAAFAGVSALGFSAAFGLRSAQAAEGDTVKQIIDVAATAETFACTHYYRALKTKLRWTTPQLAYIRAALEEELIHLEFLNANGATALADSFYFPKDTFKSALAFGNISTVAETVFVGAYLAATRRFAELGNPLLAATAAQIAVVEGQHLALVRQTSNQLPNNIAFGEGIFYNVTDAVGVVSPLLDGKKGGLGDMETAPVKYPGADEIRKAIGKSGLTPVKPFTDPSMSPTPEAATAATAAATLAATEASEEPEETEEAEETAEATAEK
jgi:hypothetical protein